MQTLTLKEALLDWTDWDLAERYLAQCLGLMTPDVKAKHVFWSNNPIGNMLTNVLEELTQQGILEKRDEPDFQFRWNSAFHGSWE
ncbi:MAG TPA: hypothetical protein PKD09_16705 [Aggregatilinea sp.]|uniref:hypothetical protein n=1 Tax=Aggregatilinea sp. TaxID=2806333 RepID=UPI002CA6F148|nr:hypothetical protein [Aggregatilinea sp.]HML23297.1 hypothetical protein [Aggregatilinea sp.]